MKNIVVVGASGHGGMILDIIEKEGRYRVVGFVDSYKKQGTKCYGHEVLGTEDDFPRLIEELQLHGAILAIGNNATRETMAKKIGDIVPNLKIVTAVHPRAVIGKGVRIGKGSAIMAGAIINSHAKVGDFCIVNTNSSLGHDGVMEDFSSIASGVCTGGNLSLGRLSAISLGANVIENINIGAYSIVGAGSLVIKNVMGFSVVYGSPARLIRRRRMDDPYLSGDDNLNSGSTPVLLLGLSGTS